MSVDLTCPECEGSGQIRLGDAELYEDVMCLRCAGFGRRRPTLDEWDELVAERDIFRGRIDNLRADLRAARDALDGDL